MLYTGGPTHTYVVQSLHNRDFGLKSSCIPQCIFSLDELGNNGSIMAMLHMDDICSPRYNALHGAHLVAFSVCSDKIARFVLLKGSISWAER